MPEPSTSPAPPAPQPRDRRPRTSAASLSGEWLTGERGLVALAVGVGIAAGAGAIAFRYLILGLTEVFSGHRDYSGVAVHAGNPHVPVLGMWFVVLAPVLGGLLYGPLVARLAPEARGHGVPEVMLAVAEHGGRIRPQVPLVKALASALCIGSGGSVGREGPIVQIGSALGSLIGGIARVTEERLRLLVACGAAGGISATFNAPIAGVFFALEIILGDFEAQAFGAVVLSSVTAAAIARAAFGSSSFLHLPAFALTSPFELVLYAVLGALAGLVGVLFIRALYGSEDLADRVWRGPEWARPAAGGALLGLLLLAVPQMYGVGYPVLSHAVAGGYVLGFVIVLLAAKIVATSLTIAIGGSGGVFAPSLFTGAMLGSAFGQTLHLVAPELATPTGAYALAGMGAVFAGCARAPITAVIILFELTGEYTIILPLMVAVVAATTVSRRLSRDTIYTLKLRRRGFTVDRPRVVSVMRSVPVSAALTRPLPPWAADPATAVRAPTPPLRADDLLEDAVRALSLSDDPELPVLAAHSDEVIGWVGHRDILRAYHRERERLSSEGRRPPGGRQR